MASLYPSFERILLYHSYPASVRIVRRKILFYTLDIHIRDNFLKSIICFVCSQRVFPSFTSISSLFSNIQEKSKKRLFFCRFFYPEFFPVQRGFSIHFFRCNRHKNVNIGDRGAGGEEWMTGMNDVNLYFTAMHRYSFVWKQRISSTCKNTFQCNFSLHSRSSSHGEKMHGRKVLGCNVFFSRLHTAFMSVHKRCNCENETHPICWRKSCYDLCTAEKRRRDFHGKK